MTTRKTTAELAQQATDRLRTHPPASARAYARDADLARDLRLLAMGVPPRRGRRTWKR